MRNFQAPIACLFLFLGAYPALLGNDCHAQDIFREKIGDDAYGVIRGGRSIFLEVTPPSGSGAQSVLGQYLAQPTSWRAFTGRGAVAIPFEKLKPSVQRTILHAVFPLDYVDEVGWRHIVRFEGERGTETCKDLSFWLTGSPDNAPLILSHEANRNIREPLKRGQRILFPQPYLQPVMKEPSPPPPPPIKPAPPISSPPPEPAAPPEEPVEDLPSVQVEPASESNELEYAEDQDGKYAIYHLKEGESLYSSVVVRFTDYTLNDDVLQACQEVAKRSGITDVRNISTRQKIKIPVELLADQYQPLGTSQRQAYEEVREESRRLQSIRIGAKDLDGVILVLDSGHGGIDPGAVLESVDLYEDEINYDIVCRIKSLLETKTRAKVRLTLEDPNQSLAARDISRFTHDKDERILTSPKYAIQDKDVAINLRWYLANDIYAKERKAGADPQKMLFVSIHCDFIYDKTVRGTMIYVPGAEQRKKPESHTTGIYASFEEVQRNPIASSTHEQRTQDEAMSRSLAECMIKSLRSNNPPIKVHDVGDPIRSVIKKSGGKSYLPAVLRNTTIPTKVLVEVANMNNPEDQRNLADPKWRQWFAEAFVEALRRHYNNH